jgi:hypothetical protein
MSIFVARMIRLGESRRRQIISSLSNANSLSSAFTPGSAGAK